jgi:hypothetical protein
MSYAQEIDFDRWEIGIDILPLIGRNVAPPSISIKKLELKQKENEFGLARRGFRLRAGCNISSPENAFPFTANNHDILFRPGYEWDRKIKSVEVFFALDLQARFQNTYFRGSDGVNEISVKNQMGSYGVSPVVGVNYKIVKNIKISLETAADLLLTRTTRSEQVGSEISTTKSNGVRIQLSPIYVLNAVFVF